MDNQILTLPKFFNFLGFQSSHCTQPIGDLAKVLDLLRDNYNPEEFLEVAASQFGELSEWGYNPDRPYLFHLPQTGHWHEYASGDWYPCNPPESGWWVLDFETSQIGPDDWRPLCAVATNGRRWLIWLPDPCGQAIDQVAEWDCKFIAHNSAFDTQWISGNPGSLCTMQMGSQLFGGSQKALSAMKGSKFVPWSGVTIPCYNSLETLANFCQIPCHPKDTRELCEKQPWAINYRDHLLEIVNYCIADVSLTYNLFVKLWPQFKHVDPNPLSWLGLLEISKYRLPVESDFKPWLVNTDEAISRSNLEWSDRIISRLREIRKEEYEFLEWVDSLFPCFSFQPSILFYVQFAAKLKPSKKPGGKSTRRNKLLTEINKVLKNVNSLYNEVLSAISELYPLSHRLYNGVKIIAPTWVFDFEPTPYNKSLPTLLGFKYNGQEIFYKYPRYNIPTIDGDTAGVWWGSEVDLEGFDNSTFPVRDYAEFCRSQNPWNSLKDRLFSARIRDGEYIPQIHKSGTVTQRLTDNVIHLIPKYDPKIPGTELFGKFKTEENELFIYFDYSGQETMIFQAIADGGVLGSSGYGAVVLAGDIHSVIRDYLRFPPNKEYRKKAKPFTFHLQYGGQEAGASLKLQTMGYSKEEADFLAHELVVNYVGKKVYINGAPFYKDGLASSGYNALSSMATSKSMRSLLLNRAAPLSMQYSYRRDNFTLTAMNWPIQATGTDFLRLSFAYARLLSDKIGSCIQPAVSVHDLPVWRSPLDHVKTNEAIVKAAHLLCVARLYLNLGFKECPLVYALPESVEIDNRLRLNHLDPYVTPSNPEGFPVEACLLPFELSLG